MKSKTKVKTEPLRLYIAYTEEVSGGQPLSDEQFSDREDEYREVHFTSICREKPEFWCDSQEVSEELFKADKVWMVVARYSDGDTFGQTHGCWKRVGLYLCLEDADDVADKIKNKSWKNGFLPWEGYFAHLEDVEIHEFTVSNQKSTKHKLIKHP